MGLLPEVGAKLVARLTRSTKRSSELIEKHAEKKLLIAALKGCMQRKTSNGRSLTCRSKECSST